MRIRVVADCKWLGWMGYSGMTVYPFVFLADSKADAYRFRVLHHEFIHVCQVRRQGWIPFYSRYLFEYLVGLVKYRSHNAAYFNITAESEAYAYQWLVTDADLFRCIGGRR